MRTVFADTFYWIALLNPKDQAHARAVSVSKSLGTAGIMTSEEVLTAMASYHDRKRGGGGRSDDEKFLRSRLCVRVGDGENKFALVSGMRRVAVVVQVGSLLQSARRLKI